MSTAPYTFEPRHVLIAGGTGLGGRAAIEALLKAHPDIQLRVPHRGRDGAFIEDPRVEYVMADLSNRADCARVMQGCDSALLAAAVTGGAMAARDRPWAQVTDNAVMDSYLLEAAAMAGVKRAVFVSTAVVYQPFDGFIRETELDWNQDPYSAYIGVGWVKRFSEKMCHFWHDKAGLECAILRLANIYGPFARFDPATANFIPALIRKAVAGDDPFQVWGSPDVARDVLHAADFGSAVVKALSVKALGCEVFNIGSGRRATVGEAVGHILAATGLQHKKVVYQAGAPTTVKERLLDISKAGRDLGWKPEIDLAAGIADTVKWWQTNRTTWTR